MRTQTTKTFQHATDGKSATRARSNWSRIRLIAFWATTFVIVFELAAGSVWNLLTIEWVEVQLRHLGYPHFFTYILGVAQAAAAVAIIAPRFPLIKEWAYVGAFFLWSGAVMSHLSVGDGPESWRVPLMFGACAIASWVLRPADRRLPETRLRRDRPADAGHEGTRARAWVVPIGLLVVLYAVSFLTLPAVEDITHRWAVELGWIDE
ncbi:DoxX family protein [Nonomuraea diastatica]|uniref:DoxX family protein n=1 Tax=Nonomuraea diastatica TaxID=1848329 RepID=A0A4R4VKX4_9ACTN|nr:DoxX family protein [Nonomuraea diastatica]TDD06252.1 DoxX family protein [Nonomuraea diastatica]